MFDEIAKLAGDPAKMFDHVAQELVARGELHQLFDLRLAQKRHALGLGMDRRQGIDDVEEPLRSRLEDAYLDACREVGALLLEAGRMREAWTYLRPTGDKQLMRQRLACVVLEEPEAEELIELALYEGVDPERGFAWLLGRQGVCNAITSLESLQQQLSLEEFAACASVLVRHVYRELRGNLRGHLKKLKGEEPQDLSVVELIDQHPELLAEGSYHLDASHLASTVRFARTLTDGALLEQALEMSEYGSRLAQDLQYPGEPPFEELYAAHKRLFSAFLGREVADAVEYFGKRAREEHDVEPHEGTTRLETFLIVLTRTGQPDEALKAYGELAPRDQALSRYAPSLLQLAELSQAWELYEEVCRQREDMIGYAVGKVAAARSQE